MCFPADLDPDARRRWLASRVAAPVAALVAAAALLEATGADAASLAPFFDASAGRFPLRKDWFYQRVLHDGGQRAVLAAAVAVALTAIASLRVRRLRRWAGAAAYLAASVAAATAIVGALKALTGRYPPWDLQPFGGKVPMTPLTVAPPPPFDSGRGFPAGHAAGGFAWVALALAARAHGCARWAWWLTPGLLLGTLFGWVQHVRGAHFPSHNLWTLAIAWCVAAVLACAFTARGWLPGGGSGPARRP